MAMATQVAMIRRAGLVSLIAAVLTAACMFLSAPALAAQDSKGTDFWLAFPGNLSEQNTQLFIAGDTATSGTVTIPGLGFSAPYTVTPGAVTTVDLPNTAQMQSSDAVEDKGVHVTSGAEVTVYGLNRAQSTTDAYLGLPTDALGTDYIDLGYKNTDIVNANQLGIAASQDGTTVTITPTVTVDGHTAGVAYTKSLDQGQTYLLRDTNPAPSDLSGTIVKSDKPISVYGGHQCANIPPGAFACDHIVEQLTATTQWGKNFLSMPLATRTGGDTFRILASDDNTTVKVNGAVVATLNRAELHEQLVDGPAQITADKPVLVMQYSNGTTFDNQTGDPFQMTIPPFEQYLSGYTVSTPAEGFDPNYINIVAPNSAVGSVKVDGVAVPATGFTAIGSSGFSGAQFKVDLGSHTVSSPQPVGVHSYGFGSFDSYGYAGGLSLAPVATVSGISLSPKAATHKVGTQGCVTAHVTDSNGGSVEGVRVDFDVSGPNKTIESKFTDAAGNAQLCYTGANLGDDTIKATVGTLSDTASKKWVTSLPPTTPPPSKAAPSYGLPDKDAGTICGRRSISLLRATVKGRKVRLAGLVGSKLYGKKITIHNNYGSRKITVRASATGNFSARVARPRRKDFVRARYRARSGAARSPKLKLPQSLTSSSIKAAAGRITVRGKVKKSVLGKRNNVVIRRLVCGRYRIVGSARPDAKGRYKVSFAGASTLDSVAFYRAEAKVLRNPRSKVYVTQYARAIAIRVSSETG